MTGPPAVTDGAVDAAVDAVPLVDVSEVRGLVERAAQLCDEVGRPSGAQGLRAALEAVSRDELRVLVAGETSTGKSALLNALLGRPGLSPTGLADTTACPIAFRHGRPESATAAMLNLVTGELDARPLALDRIHEVAVVNVADLAVRVDVTVEAPLLAGLVLVDVPGFGGLHGGHAQLVLTELADADALLLAFDAARPLPKVALDFLAEAAERVATILVAATRTDTAPEFDTTVAESRAHLGARPRLGQVPVLAVSSRLAEQAAALRAQSDLDPVAATLAARKLELSGVPTLTQTLHTQATRAARLRWANLSRRASAVFAGRAVQLRAGAPADGNVQAARTALRAQEERVKALQAGEQAARVKISHQLQRVATGGHTQFEEAASALRRQFRARVESCTRRQLDQLPADLEGALGAAAAAALLTQDRDVTSLGDLVAERADAADAPVELAAALAAAGRARRQGDEPAGQPDLNLSQVGAPLRVRGQAMFAAVSGLGIGRFAVVAAASVIAGPAGWAVGGSVGAAVFGGMLWRNANVTEQQLRFHLGSWVDRAVNDARDVMRPELAERARAVREQLESNMARWFGALSARRGELNRQLRELSERDAPDPAAEEQAAALERLAARADAVAARLLAAAPAEAPDGSRTGSRAVTGSASGAVSRDA